MACKDFGYKSSEHLADHQEISVPAESNDTMGPKFQRSNLLVSKGEGLFSIKAFLRFSNLKQVHTPSV